MATKPKPRQFNTETFIKSFNSIALHKHRYEVFSDFVKMSAIALHNAVAMAEHLEKEYLEIIGKYSKAEAEQFCLLLANLVDLLEPEPIDILGQLYMELDLSSSHTAQFFSPSPIAQLLAKLTHGNKLDLLAEKDFITLSEPACGAGGMVLAFAKEMIHHGYNPADRLWVQCVDLDRVASMMCYVQLSLWNIPAQVIVGNSLTLEFREVFYTPSYYLFGWERKLRLRSFFDLMRGLETTEVEEPEPKEPVTVVTSEIKPPQGEVVAEPKNTNTHKKTKKEGLSSGVQVDLFDFIIDH
jgi:hypothetical protein